MASKTLKFPDGFMWGTATAAYQIEGAVNKDGRQPSIWDRFCNTAGTVKNNDTGETACDHYNRMESDVQSLIKPLRTKYYRFSLSWSRLQTFEPGVDTAVENAAGIAFYNRLIDCLLQHGITPVVTLYHWDLPTAVHDRFDGWAGDKGIADAFAAYADLCFRCFGDRVQWWITLNEPWCSAFLGYETGEHAPGRNATSTPGVHVYRAGHNLLLAHARAVHVYRTKFQQVQRGRIAITLNTQWYEASDASDEDAVLAARRGLHFELGWFAHPVYKGDYPPVMRKAVGERLPRFTAEERELLLGSSDFFGLNHYTTTLTRGPLRHDVDGGADAVAPSYHTDKATEDFQRADWEKSDMGWPIVAEGFAKLLRYVQKEYNPHGGIIVTENGVAVAETPPASSAGDAHDERIRFYERYISAMHDAMTVAGEGCDGDVKADVRGYFLWSLMDNFEWAFGYEKRFGLFYVDYDTLVRTAKPAVKWYADVIGKNALPLVTDSE